TKKYMIVIENKIYFGLFEKEDFIGFVDINSLNLGEIEPVNFVFRDSNSYIYETPDLKMPTPIHIQKNIFKANSYFKYKNKDILGFTFSNRNFWVDVNDVSLDTSPITYVKNINLKECKESFHVNSIRVDKSSYYSMNDEFETTNKLLDIIENFENIQSGSKIYHKFDLNIGIICDEFMYYALKDSANFKYIPYEDNLNVDTSLDLVLIVTTWRGLDGSWVYVANPEGTKRQVLNNLIDKYNEQGIPTIFYSKEDPVNYDRF